MKVDIIRGFIGVRELYLFDAKMITNNLITWISDWFEINGCECNAVVGISGGKNSSVCAALCSKALGKNRVIGVLMPNLKQDDIGDSYQLIKYLGIKSYLVPISVAVGGIYNQIKYAGINISDESVINLPSWIRMSVLYAVSQSVNGRVISTCNLSERRAWCLPGEDMGEVTPLGRLTIQEVEAIGNELGLPNNLVYKMPSNDPHTNRRR